jgi:hypothetical protein
MDTIGPS